MVESQKHSLIWQNQTQKATYLWFHLYEISSKGKTIDTESSEYLELGIGKGNDHK